VKTVVIAAFKYIEGLINFSSVKLLPAGLAHVLSINVPIMLALCWHITFVPT